MESVDVPGVVGRVGSLLGAHGINIAEWRLGRIAPAGEALAFINLDSPAPQDVLDELVCLEGVNRVRQVSL
jgi:D-3-phosphoglycerate dehydrogenase